MAGSPQELAETIGCLRQSVWDWLNKNAEVSARYAVRIQAAYGIPARDLCPSVFDQPDLPSPVKSNLTPTITDSTSDHSDKEKLSAPR